MFQKDFIVAQKPTIVSAPGAVANGAGGYAARTGWGQVAPGDLADGGTTRSGEDPAMDRLRQRYVERLHEVRTVILRDAGLDPAADGPRADYAALRAEAHKLTGSGATYGFDAISEAAGALEALLDMGTPLAADIEDLARLLVEAIDAAVRNAIRPVAPAAPAAPHDDAPLANPLPQILIVDDDVAVTEMVAGAFHGRAMVTAVHDGPEAIAAIGTMRPDLILLDNELRGAVSGTDILGQIRNDPATRDLPVVMLTASASAEAVLAALELGATDYVLKPFDPARLRDTTLAMMRKTAARVLIVDDDEVVRELLDHKFRHHGYRTRCVADGAEAWDLLAAERFDLVVLDRMMPGMDGMTLLHRLQAQPRTADLPVVFLTAQRYGNDVVDGLASGAADYVTKPFDPDEVVARCEKYLRTPGK